MEKQIKEMLEIPNDELLDIINNTHNTHEAIGHITISETQALQTLLGQIDAHEGILKDIENKKGEVTLLVGKMLEALNKKYATQEHPQISYGSNGDIYKASSKR
jgi:hypothetical protein